ncbi:S16 family serine protease [Microbacterium sp. Kw_RZR3]|uniref:S16 family serine protease n=1 Tax=Microbacterium sp. Kw_RZR3 TaxID=3032903 RepID=UPI0023D9D94B|nr:S16 family serine protease [Microbacterium sp. Kw_RZR3]
MRACAAAVTALALACTLVLAGCDLGFSLGFGGKPDGHFEGSELTVPVLYVSGGKGGVATQRITAEAADGGDLSIDITENDVSGVAPVTQSATWTAVTAATLLTGARPDTAYTFGFDARINTPAAGAVTAVGVLALYYGSEIQPGVALAGGVTPFGTVSPVAGLPEQVSAAIEAGGIDTILVPVGQRIAADANGQPIDLDQVAATGGMTITEVADVASAYAIMTGEDLPEAAFPTPAASPTPLPTATEGPAEPGDDAFDIAVNSALARAEASLTTASDASLAERSRATADRARALREAGDGGGAFAAAATAADDAAVAGAPAADAVSVGVTRTAAEDLLDEASQSPPETLDAADLSLEVVGAAADAYALAAYAEAALDAGGEAAPTAAALAASALARAQESAALRDALGTGAGSISRDADLDGLGSLLRRAAIAATDAYESRAGDAPVSAGDLPAVRLAAFDAARDDLESIADDDAWLGLALAATAFSRTVPPLATQQAVRVPEGVDPTAAVQQRIAVGDEYAVRAVDALADAGAEVPLVRGALSDATATATAAPAPGASSVYATPFLRARVLAFAAGVERE